MLKVTNRTRASRTNGKFIYCPHCGSQHRVFHFAWTALKCADCGNWTDKCEYLLEKPTLPKEDRPVIALIFDRSFWSFIDKFNEHILYEHGYELVEVDSSGTRTAWHYRPIGNDDYDSAEDLPIWVWDDLRECLSLRHKMIPEDLSVCRRMVDPGLGIMLPEDLELIKQGGLPDGCIRPTVAANSQHEPPQHPA